MAKYESQIKYINAPVESVYRTLSNLENFRPLLENAANNPMVKQKLEEAGQDPSQLDKLKDVQLTNDRISIPAPMIGEIALAIIEREENKTIKFQTEQSPIEANLWIQVLPTSIATNAEHTGCGSTGSGNCGCSGSTGSGDCGCNTPQGCPGSKLKLTLKADLNPMIKMMIGSKLEDGIDKFADMLAMLPYGMV